MDLRARVADAVARALPDSGSTYATVMAVADAIISELHLTTAEGEGPMDVYVGFGPPTRRKDKR